MTAPRPMRSFWREQEAQLVRELSAVEANLASYVWDASGQCRGRCPACSANRGDAAVDHHPECPRA